MRFLVSCFLLITLFSCNSNETISSSNLPNAIGSYSNVLVICENSEWKAGLDSSVIKAVSVEMDGLIQVEKEFNITQIRPQAFNSMFKKNRAVLLIAIADNIKKASFSRKTNVFAEGQKLVQIKAPNLEAAIDLINRSARRILFEFKKHRTAMIQRRAKLNRSKKLEKNLQGYHAASLIIPAGYKLDKDTHDFVYFYKKEQKPCEYGRNSHCYYQNGIMVYTFPYESDTIFSAAYMQSKRDSLTELYIEGPATKGAEKAFMQVEPKLPVLSKEISLNGKFAFESKGWWKMKNGIMGGPFINVAIVDEMRQRVICVDGFSFAPNFDKRQFVTELEAICLSLKTL